MGGWVDVECRYRFEMRDFGCKYAFLDAMCVFTPEAR